jgi:hypothetical protein
MLKCCTNHSQIVFSRILRVSCKYRFWVHRRLFHLWSPENYKIELKCWRMSKFAITWQRFLVNQYNNKYVASQEAPILTALSSRCRRNMHVYKAVTRQRLSGICFLFSRSLPNSGSIYQSIVDMRGTPSSTSTLPCKELNIEHLYIWNNCGIWQHVASFGRLSELQSETASGGSFFSLRLKSSDFICNSYPRSLNCYNLTLWELEISLLGVDKLFSEINFPTHRNGTRSS